MHTLRRWHEPTGRDLDQALATATRYKLSADLAVFLPPEPGRFAPRSRKDAYKGVVIALKRVDALGEAERDDAIAQVRGLLGAK